MLNELQLQIYRLEYTVAPETPTKIQYWFGAYIRNNLLYAAASIPVDGDRSLRDIINNEVAGQNDYPRAYSIQCDPVLSSIRVNGRNSLTFSILLFGEFSRLRDSFHNAVCRMCENGFGHPKTRMQIISFSGSPAPDFHKRNETSGTYRIDFITPTSIYSNRAKNSSRKLVLDKQNGMPSFYYIILALTRRINRLSTAYGSGEMMSDEEIDSWCENARKAQIEECMMERIVLEGTPKTEKTRPIYFSGYIGHMTISNVDKQYLPLLLYGQYTNVGNDTAYGLGQYQLTTL